MAWEMIQGDRENDLLLVCGVNSAPTDLTGITSATLVWTTPSGARSEHALTITLPALGVVQYAWADNDPSDTGGETGVHEMRVRVLHASGELQTFPSDGSAFRVRINAAP